MVVRLCLAVSCVVCLAGSVKADVIALKRDAGLATGGTLASQFAALGDSDVVLDSVKDARMVNDANSRWQNYGTSVQATISTNNIVVGFDLSAYAGATINNAQIRVLCGNGNNTMQWAPIKSHDWAEGNKNGGYPGANPAAAGVCWASPAGLYTTALGAGGWGTNSDSMFSAASDGQDIYALTNFNTYASNNAVADVTSIVQDWVNGTKPNYGLYIAAANRTPYLSEKGTSYEPVLFLDFTPPAPEPATLALLALGGLAMLRRRGQ